MSTYVLSCAPGGEVVVDDAEDGKVCTKVRLEQQTVRLWPTSIAELLGRDESLCSGHVQNASRYAELAWKATVAENATVQLGRMTS